MSERYPGGGKKLTEKQRRFAIEYLRDLNATEAAIRAGYSEASAGIQGHHLLHHPRVKKAIDKLMVARQRRVEVSIDDIVKGLAEIAFGLDSTKKEKLKAFELLGKHLAMFTDRVQVNDLREKYNSMTTEELRDEMRKRLEEESRPVYDNMGTN